MTDPTYPDYLQLRTGQAPPPDPHEAGVRVYADDDGALRSIQSDGSDAPVGGGGVTPPVVIEGTDPGTIPLTVTTATGQSAEGFLVQDDSGGWALRITDGATALFAGYTGQSGSDFSEVNVGGGITMRGPAGATEFVVDDGRVVVANIPEGDPGHSGQLYSVAGVVHISL